MVNLSVDFIECVPIISLWVFTLGDHFAGQMDLSFQPQILYKSCIKRKKYKRYRKFKSKKTLTNAYSS